MSQRTAPIIKVIELPLLAIDVQIVDKVGGTHGSATVDVVLG